MSHKVPRLVTLVGSYMSGKTTLMETMLFHAGAISRKGSIDAGNTVGDSSLEARSRGMSTEMNIASFEYLGDPWCVIDCPGSVELLQDSYNAMLISDIVVVVCEPDDRKIIVLEPIFRFLEHHKIPHMVFINRMDVLNASVREAFEVLQETSSLPLILRSIPLREEENIVGHIDLVSERAWQWEQDKPASLVQIPALSIDREQEARTELLETVADYDDVLLEQLLEDTIPASDEIYKHVTQALQDAFLVPVFFGSAENGNGVWRLLKALRHESPDCTKTFSRLELQEDNGIYAPIFKTLYSVHGGKMAISRIFGGTMEEGMSLSGNRISTILSLFGNKQEKVKAAPSGSVVAFSRLDEVVTGQTLVERGSFDLAFPPPLKPLYALAVRAIKRDDEVKLGTALAKIVEEDSSLNVRSDQDAGELLIEGQGDMHLQIVADRLRARFGLEVSTTVPSVPYKETVGKTVNQHARHKKQSGGHGQFADIVVDIVPLSRGEGIVFSDTISGGVVPSQYIPAVEMGVRDALLCGPLGFPVIDVEVILRDGKFHAVDSSEMAFKIAGSLAMREGLPKCKPILLEPILEVQIYVPAEFTSKIQRVITGRRGQVLGFDKREGWRSWDEVSAYIPQSETHDLINEIRSLTLGVGTYTYRYNRLQELVGRDADNVISARHKQLKEA